MAHGNCAPQLRSLFGKIVKSVGNGYFQVDFGPPNGTHQLPAKNLATENQMRDAQHYEAGRYGDKRGKNGAAAADPRFRSPTLESSQRSAGSPPTKMSPDGGDMEPWGVQQETSEGAAKWASWTNKWESQGPTDPHEMAALAAAAGAAKSLPRGDAKGIRMPRDQQHTANVGGPSVEALEIARLKESIARAQQQHRQFHQQLRIRRDPNLELEVQMLERQIVDETALLRQFEARKGANSAAAQQQALREYQSRRETELRRDAELRQDPRYVQAREHQMLRVQAEREREMAQHEAIVAYARSQADAKLKNAAKQHAAHAVAQEQFQAKARAEAAIQEYQAKLRAEEAGRVNKGGASAADQGFDDSRTINLGDMSKEAQYVCMRLCSWTSKAFDEGGTLEQIAPLVDAYLHGVHQVISTNADPNNAAASARMQATAREKAAAAAQDEQMRAMQQQQLQQQRELAELKQKKEEMEQSQLLQLAQQRAQAAQQQQHVYGQHGDQRKLLPDFDLVEGGTSQEQDLPGSRMGSAAHSPVMEALGSSPTSPLISGIDEHVVNNGSAVASPRDSIVKSSKLAELRNYQGKERLTVIRLLVGVVNDMTQWVLGPEATIQVYGSAGTTMFLDDISDVDMTIVSPKSQMTTKSVITEYKAEKVCKLRKVYNEIGMLPEFRCERLESGARVPVAVITHETSGVSLDITVNNLLPIWNTRLIQAYLDLHPMVWQMVAIIKAWAKQVGVCDARSGFLSSYTWTLLVIFFLQATKRIPCLQSEKYDRREPVNLRAQDSRTSILQNYRVDYMSRENAQKVMRGQLPSSTLLFFLRFFPLENRWNLESDFEYRVSTEIATSSLNYHLHRNHLLQFYTEISDSI